MKGTLAVFLFIALTAICWGIYGPVLHEGQLGMGGSQWRPFMCVGLAYFGIAVLVPGVLLNMRGEVGRWSFPGTLWSLVAGAAGAIGALGIILAFQNHGNPIYVMPLVFGGAPVVNTFLTMWMAKSYKDAGPFFIAGLILVVVGAVTVLIFKPSPLPPAAMAKASAPASEKDAAPAAVQPAKTSLTGKEVALVALWVATTAFCWGVYGPLLHKGQAAMAGSRLRPLICVGLAYFVIAVLLPLVIMAQHQEPGTWNFSGTAWSLAGGAAGAIGALGLILAFNAGGKPIYVMPLVFGGAPVVNTFTTMFARGGFAAASPLFYAGLIVVAVGAVTVLVFAPKGKPHATSAPMATPRPETAVEA